MEFVKTIGNIVATTWYIIDIEVKKIYDDEASILEYVISLGNEQIYKKVTNIVRVESLNILKSDLSSSIIKVRIHYAVLEDISMEG